MKRIALLSMCVLVVAASAGCLHKRMLLVTGYPDGTPGVAETAAALEGAIRKEQFSVGLDVFNMNATGHPTEIWRDQMARMAVVRTSAMDPAVVFVGGDDAARYYAQRLIDRPVNFIFLGLKGDPADYGFTKALNATGIREQLAVKEAIALMAKLVPLARGVAVLADRSLEGDAVVKQVRAASDTAIPIVDIRQAGTLTEWMAAVNDLQTKADVLCIGSYRSVLPDENSKEAVSPSELLRMTSEANHLPDFSFWPDAVGPHGVLACVSVPLAAQARMAAKMAIRFMYYSVPLHTMPIAACSEKETKISRERATRLGVTVPAGEDTTPLSDTASGKSTL